LIADLHTVVGEGAHETRVEDNEPTMADKLTSLDAAVNDNADIDERQDLPQTALPSADSVHVLLKQALNADDHALLIACTIKMIRRASLIQALLSDVNKALAFTSSA